MFDAERKAAPLGLTVVTAAHCLTAPVTVRGDIASKGATLPPAHGASYSEERTYPRLLEPLGAKPRVPAECLFVDAVADLAVLGPVDGQELYDKALAYEKLVEALDPLPLGSLNFGYRYDKGGRSVNGGLSSLQTEGVR